jgi:hypothetical protein
MERPLLQAAAMAVFGYGVLISGFLCTNMAITAIVCL